MFFKKKKDISNLIIARLIEYFKDEPYCLDSLWSWSENKRISIIFPELSFRDKQSSNEFNIGFAFSVCKNLEETEELRKIFIKSEIPFIFLKEIPEKVDLKKEIEAFLQDRFTLLSIT